VGLVNKVCLTPVWESSKVEVYRVPLGRSNSCALICSTISAAILVQSYDFIGGGFHCGHVEISNCDIFRINSA